MTTSTDQINDLISKATDLVAFFEGERDALVTARTNLPDLLELVLYVDDLNGLPGGAGTLADPMDSIDTAIESLKNGQAAEIRLLADAVWNEEHRKTNCPLQIFGWDGGSNSLAQRTLTFANQAANSPGALPGIHVSGSASVQIKSCDIVLSPDTTTGLAHFTSWGMMAIIITGGEIIGTVGGGALLKASFGSFSLAVHNLVMTDMAGRWLTGFAAGTPITTDATGGLIDPAVVN